LQSASNLKQTDEPAKLVVASIDKPEVPIEVGDLLTIGRSPTNQLVIDDNRASRNHAEIRKVAGRYRLSDLGSFNGTWVNGRRLTVPKDLEGGDEILIGAVQLRFLAPRAKAADETPAAAATRQAMTNRLVVVLVADVRNFTTMSESLPKSEFSLLISNWFREASDIIEAKGGTIDKYIGDAVMAFWVVVNNSEPSKEVDAALETSRELFARAGVFSARISSQFAGYQFRIGIGLNMGPAMMGNVGTSKNPSFSILGDSVNVAFRLEALSKEKGFPIIAGRSVTDCASGSWRLTDLGLVEVKGRVQPVHVCGIACEGQV